MWEYKESIFATHLSAVGQRTFALSPMSLAFLANKGFHPSNFANQRKVFIAEQKAADEAKKQKEREKQLKEEQSYMEAKKALSGVSTSEDSKRAVNFMYEPPPGYLTSLSAANAPKEEKKDDRPAWAKNAPVEGSYAAGMDLNVKPLGIEVRRVRCIRCGEWGHTAGERDCKMKDFNPNDATRRLREDPMSALFAGAKPGGTKYAMKGFEREANPDDPNSQIIADPEEDPDAEFEFISTLTEKEKKKLLKKLKKKRKEEKRKEKDRKKKSRSKSSKKADSDNSSSDDSQSEDSKSSGCSRGKRPKDSDGKSDRRTGDQKDRDKVHKPHRK